jgi:hypothetical protein
MAPVTIDDIRQLDGALIALRVREYHRPWRLFGRGRIRGFRRQDGHDITGWICAMNPGNTPDRAYVAVRPSWTAIGSLGFYVYLRDIYDLQVLMPRSEELLPGNCPGQYDLAAYLIAQEQLDPVEYDTIETHLQWCWICRGMVPHVRQHADTFLKLRNKNRG